MTLVTFDLETEKGCDSEDACRCANELLHKLKTNDGLGGSLPHPHGMAAANRTLLCDKKQNFISTHKLNQASHFDPDLLTSPCEDAVQANSQL